MFLRYSPFIHLYLLLIFSEFLNCCQSGDCEMVSYYLNLHFLYYLAQPVARGKESTYNAGAAGDMVSIPGLGWHPGGGHKQLIPLFLPGESHGQRSLRAIVHRVLKSQTRLKWLSMHTCVTISSSVIVTFVLPPLWNRHIHSFAHILMFLFLKMISESSLYIL